MKTRIRECRCDWKHWTLQFTADQVKENFQSLSRIELGTQEPPAKLLFDLADLFGCSIDYLTYRSDQKNYSNGVVQNNFKELPPTYFNIVLGVDALSDYELIKMSAIVEMKLESRGLKEKEVEHKKSTVSTPELPKGLNDLARKS